MFLTDIVLVTVGLGSLIGGGYWAILRTADPNLQRKYPPAHLLAAIAAISIVFILMCLRSLGFGVDTVTYADIFQHYCSGGSLSDYESSFSRATLLLNGLMFGGCDTSLVPAAWIFAIVAPLLAMRAPVEIRAYFICALLLSLIGIELATNALRQGLSVGFMVLAVSFGRRQPVSMLCFAALSVLFHSSAALFLVAYLLAQFRWLPFLALLISLIVLTVTSLDAQVALPLASDFLYEVQKYAAHEDDELWIRVLAFACVVAALLAPLFSRRPELPVKEMLRAGPYAVALRLGITCIPFLALPYFGYRFIYGVYPVLLLLTLSSEQIRASRLDRQFIVLVALNLLILLTWSAGSSYMREVPFI